jgi:hypothetical protein
LVREFDAALQADGQQQVNRQRLVNRLRKTQILTHQPCGDT